MRPEDGASLPSGRDLDEMVQLMGAMAAALEALHGTVGMLSDVVGSIVATQSELLGTVDELRDEEALDKVLSTDEHRGARRHGGQYRAQSRARVQRAELLVNQARVLHADAVELLERSSNSWYISSDRPVRRAAPDSAGRGARRQGVDEDHAASRGARA